MEITRGVMNKPLRVVVYGPEGIGKTTFASNFPKPLFIDTENSTEFMDVARFPKPSSWTMLLSEVEEAKKLAGTYQTLVLDTADWAETLCKNEIIASKQLTGIEDMGYGKGYVYLAERFGKLLDKLTDIRDTGMNVVITAHSTLRKFEQPDEMGAYDRYELKLEKKTAALLKEWADMMLFANYETYIVKESGKEKGSKGKAQGGRRVMYTAHHPCWDAKNRQGLADKLPFSFDEIAHCLPGNREPISRQTEQMTSGQLENGSTVPRQTERELSDRHSKSAPKTAQTAAEEIRAKPPESVAEAAAENNDLPFSFGNKDKPEQDQPPQALADLMREARVAEEDVRKVIQSRGYFTADTPWIVMANEGFVDGWIIPFWEKIVETIQADPHWLPV